MAMEEQFIELIGEFEPDKWYIIKPTIPTDPAGINTLKNIFQRHSLAMSGGILILAYELDIQRVEYHTIRSTLRAFRINIDILRALYRQIKWRALQKPGLRI
jgi:hypothetical protein